MKGVRFLTTCIVITLFFCSSGFAQKDQPGNELSRLTSRAYSAYLSHPDTAILLSKKTLNMAVERGDVYYEGYSYYVLSKAYWVKANFRLSTEYGFKALKIFENSPYKKQWSESLLSVARTLVELGNFSKARALMNQSLLLGMQEHDKRMLAATYREMSFMLAETGLLDSALQYADKGITLFESTGDSTSISILFGRKARIYFEKKDFRRSREYAFKSLRLDTLVKNRRALGVTCFLAAQNEHVLKNMTQAERLLKRSIDINHELGNLTWLINGHALMAELCLETNRHEEAIRHLQLVSQYKDSLYNAEKSGQIQEMQSLYELEGKEHTIKLLESENTLHQQQVRSQRWFLAFLLGGILLLVALIFFLVRLRNIQQQANRDLAAKNVAIEQQKEEIQAQAEKLQQLNQLQTKLFSVISHDLRGPVSNLQILLELFTKQLMTTGEMITVSNKLRANLNVTQRTLENLLNWALSQMEGIKTEKCKIDMRACIDEACKLMEENAQRKSITLHKNITSDLSVWADPDQVQLVLRNLIQNGIKFSKIGDHLVISTSKQQRHCCITIQDTGIGMSMDEIETVVGSSTHFTKEGTQQEKGTGLGLMLCKEFIERNAGSFSIKSKLGEGTEVSFTLELAE